MLLRVGSGISATPVTRFSSEGKQPIRTVTVAAAPAPKPATVPEWISYCARQLVAMLPEMRKSAQKELEALADAPKIEIITALSTHANEYVRAGAAKAVTSISKARKADRDTLIALFCRDPHPVVQEQGARALPWVSNKALQNTLLGELQPIVEQHADPKSKVPRYQQESFKEAVSWAGKEITPKGRLKSMLRSLLTSASGLLNRGVAALS